MATNFDWITDIMNSILFCVLKSYIHINIPKFHSRMKFMLLKIDESFHVAYITSLLWVGVPVG